jgi:hypothetical protein
VADKADKRGIAGVGYEPPSGSTIRVERIPKSTANPEMIAITLIAT